MSIRLQAAGRYGLMRIPLQSAARTCDGATHATQHFFSSVVKEKGKWKKEERVATLASPASQRRMLLASLIWRGGCGRARQLACPKSSSVDLGGGDGTGRIRPRWVLYLAQQLHEGRYLVQQPAAAAS